MGCDAYSVWQLSCLQTEQLRYLPLNHCSKKSLLLLQVLSDHHCVAPTPSVVFVLACLCQPGLDPGLEGAGKCPREGVGACGYGNHEARYW